MRLNGNGLDEFFICNGGISCLPGGSLGQCTRRVHLRKFRMGGFSSWDLTVIGPSPMADPILLPGTSTSSSRGAGTGSQIPGLGAQCFPDRNACTQQAREPCKPTVTGPRPPRITDTDKMNKYLLKFLSKHRQTEHAATEGVTPSLLLEHPPAPKPFCSLTDPSSPSPSLSP